jgi:hypothetical protein
MRGGGDEGSRRPANAEKEDTTRIEPLEILRLEAPMSALMLLVMSAFFEWKGAPRTTTTATAEASPAEASHRDAADPHGVDTVVAFGWLGSAVSSCLSINPRTFGSST